MAQAILLVEDNVNDRTLLEHAFRKAAPHLDLRMAKNIFEAEDYLQARGAFADRGAHPLPALILLDLKLPKKSGLEFLGWIRQQSTLAAIPVIVLSSSQESKDIDRAYKLGARSYLVKSVDLDEMVAYIQGIGAMTLLLEPPAPSPKA